jgi:transposase
MSLPWNWQASASRSSSTAVHNYDIHDSRRFPSVQNFASYARLVKCSKESGGKRLGTSGSKIGNAHLKWAFLKPPRCSSATILKGKSFSHLWRKSMIKVKR